MKTDLITSMAVLWSAAGLLIADIRVALGADGDLAGDLPQVLTPSRLPQRLDETPSTVTIIDRAMIEASGARRLVDVLRLAPGFQVGYKNNNLPTATYHGLSDEYARRVPLLLNGQRIFQYSRGVVEWNNLPIPLESIERIEVVRGPDAAAYGSNALQAVINIRRLSSIGRPDRQTLQTWFPPWPSSSSSAPICWDRLVITYRAESGIEVCFSGFPWTVSPL